MLKRSLGRCVFALLRCPDLVLMALIHHAAGIKDGLHERGMQQMPLMPPKPMFSLALVCQSYDLEGWILFLDTFRWVFGLNRWFTDIWYIRVLQSLRGSKAQGFVLVLVSVQLLGNRG